MRRPRPSARPPLAKHAPLLIFCSGFLGADNAMALSTPESCLTMRSINHFSLGESEVRNVKRRRSEGSR